MVKKQLKNKLIQPFLKWAGGKRQLLPQIEKAFPKKFDTYYEPFLGGGAVLFHLQPKKAIVNDYNSDLINCYLCIRDHYDELINKLHEYEDKNDSESFYEIRGKDRLEEYKDWDSVSKAARLIYLNRTCYNGLFRLNSQGYFNTPFGAYKNPCICNEPILKELHQYFTENEIEFKNGDFYDACIDAPKGSFIYFDPPYEPLKPTSNFVSYTELGFTQNDQRRLKELCDILLERGCYVVVSNSNAKFIKELYSDKTKYRIRKVNARRNINSKAEKRGEIKEVLIIGKPTDQE